MKHVTLKEKAVKTNYLGIDYGSKKIGISIAPEGIMASGIFTLANDKNFYPRLKIIIEENEIGAVVTGLPLNLDGTSSSLTRKTADFIAKLKENFSGIKVDTYDERLSTQEARRNLFPKEEDHKEAARIILQGYLDRKKNLGQ